MSRLRIFPATLKQANELVAAWHRHHKPARGHRFSIGVKAGDRGFARIQTFVLDEESAVSLRAAAGYSTAIVAAGIGTNQAGAVAGRISRSNRNRDGGRIWREN